MPVLQTEIFDMKKFLKEFKEFAVKGNVMDMAVGVIIGGAFGKIVSSLVNDVIMPLISKVTGGATFTELKYVLTPASPDGSVEAVTLNYGSFIQNIVDFVIIAFCIFMALKFMMSLRRKKEVEEVPAPAPEPTPQEKLLAEIRDLLRQKQNADK